MLSVERARLRWMKSSYSGGNGNCVEVALGVDAVAARDSKDPQGAVLVFSRDQWASFVSALRGAGGPFSPC